MIKTTCRHEWFVKKTIIMANNVLKMFSQF